MGYCYHFVRTEKKGLKESSTDKITIINLLINFFIFLFFFFYLNAFRFFLCAFVKIHRGNSHASVSLRVWVARGGNLQEATASAAPIDDDDDDDDHVSGTATFSGRLVA